MPNKAVNADKRTPIRPKKLAPEESNKKKIAKNNKSIEKKRVQTRGAAKAQLKFEKDHIPMKNPKETLIKRMQPKRGVKEPQEHEPSPTPVEDPKETLIKRVQPKRNVKEREPSPVPVKEKKTVKAIIKPWNKQQKAKISVEVGQFILAKQKYSVPWPSKVLAIRSKTIDVHFYGDGRTGPVKCDDVYSISDSSDTILDCLRRNIPGYSKGIKELEILMKVPDELSLLNFV